VAEVQARYASWTVVNLIAAIDRQLGDLNTSAAARPALLGVGAALRGREWGLVTSQRATDVLTDDGLHAINTTAFLHRFTPDGHGGVGERVGRGDLFIVDEAAMTATAELDRITELVRAGGGKLVFTDDHRQLGSVGAGGVLELLAADNGAFELAQIHRFTAGWEGPASAPAADRGCHGAGGV
jgi:hypothetical protein